MNISAEEFYDIWRKQQVYHRVGRLPEWKMEEAFAFAEAYASHISTQPELPFPKREHVLWCNENHGHHAPACCSIHCWCFEVI